MNTNIDAIIFTKNLTSDLDNDGLFDPKVDSFMDKEFFYEEMLMIVENNIKNTGDPMITEQQLEEAITNSRKRAIEDAMNSLVQKGILTPKAMSPNGDIFCGISDKVKIIIKNI